MDETVNIPLLLLLEKRGRRSETPADLRYSRLKGVEVDSGRQIHLEIRT